MYFLGVAHFAKTANPQARIRGNSSHIQTRPHFTRGQTGSTSTMFFSLPIPKLSRPFFQDLSSFYHKPFYLYYLSHPSSLTPISHSSPISIPSSPISIPSSPHLTPPETVEGIQNFLNMTSSTLKSFYCYLFPIQGICRYPTPSCSPFHSSSHLLPKHPILSPPCGPPSPLLFPLSFPPPPGCSSDSLLS